MLRLMLLRHAKAIHSAAYADIERPLIQKGLEGAALVGHYIANQKLTPHHALVSSARRTRETWEIIKQYTGETLPHFDSNLYLASPESILTEIRKTGCGSSTLLVIGHNPGLALLASALVGAGSVPLRQEMHSRFPTSALAVMEFDGNDWAEIELHKGTLIYFVYPKLLAAMNDSDV